MPRLSPILLLLSLVAAACGAASLPAPIGACGDHQLDDGEQCDDGNDLAGDGCSPTCRNELATACGDGRVDLGEPCDDGNTTAGDGCSPTCTIEAGSRCGDGHLDPGELCDDGNTTAGDGCSPTCASEAGPRCGDGHLDPTEACDDGNLLPGDGCSPECELELPTACGLTAQDCPSALACDLDGAHLPEAGTHCRAVTVDGDERDTCASPSQCGPGYSCVGAAGDGTCLRFCDGDSDCSPPGGLCAQRLTYAAGQPIPGVFLCTQNCSPLTSAGCPNGWGCSATHSPLPGDTRPMTLCHVTGAGNQGAGCITADDCQAGFTCIGTGQGDHCLRNCVVGSGAGIGCGALPGTTCRALANPPVIGGLEYGVCF